MAHILAGWLAQRRIPRRPGGGFACTGLIAHPLLALQ
jgi:hypothetical protein